MGADRGFGSSYQWVASRVEAGSVKKYGLASKGAPVGTPCLFDRTASCGSILGEGKLQVQVGLAIGNKVKRIYLYVLNGMAEWEIGNILQALSMKSQLKNDHQDYDIHTISHDGKPVKTLGGLTITPDGSLEMLSGDHAVALLLPGADTWGQQLHRPILEIAENYLGQGVLVAAICGATLALANRGVLNHFEHTSNSPEYLSMFATNYSGQEFYRGENVWVGKNLITANSAAGLEWAKAILEYLNVYPTETINTWYQYYSTGNPEYFFKLMAN